MAASVRRCLRRLLNAFSIGEPKARALPGGAKRHPSASADCQIKVRQQDGDRSRLIGNGGDIREVLAPRLAGCRTGP